MPNLVAHAALLIWPAVALLLFRARPVEQAAVLCVVLSFLFLPEGTSFDLPGMPALDKQTLPNLALLILVAAFAGPRLRLLPDGWVPKLCLAALILGPPLTMLTNTDVLVYGPTVLPAQTLYDGVSAMVRALLTMVPFFVGLSLLGSVEGHRLILRVLMGAGVVYAALMAVEIRLSPQLHTWVYGFFPHSFIQQIRGDGFRPVVFQIHGLWTAFFAMTATVAAAALWRAAGRERRGPLLAALLWIGGILVLSRSLGALAFALALVPLVLFLGTRTQIRIAAVLASIALLYPMLRGAHLVPVETVMEIADGVSVERGESLRFRLENEEILLARAAERPAFGWGIWGRNRVFDPETGRDISVTDGTWIIQIGSFGWIGYLGLFGLLAWPVFRSAWQTQAPPAPETAALALLVAITMIELLPNSTFQPWLWLMAGAVLRDAARARQTSPALPGPEEAPGRILTIL